MAGEPIGSQSLVVHRHAVRQMCDASRGGVMNWAKENPFTFQVTIATVKTSLADIIVQKTVEGKKEIDWKRNAVFVAFGSVYLGVFQWWLYVTKFKQWFPQTLIFTQQNFKQKLANTAGQIDLMKQVFFDNFIHYTFIYFPVFYIFKESIQGETDVAKVVTAALTKYATNFWPDNYAIWALWVPMDTLIYAAPIWMRLPLNHSVSFLWTMMLSCLRGEKIEDDVVEGVKAVVASTE